MPDEKLTECNYYSASHTRWIFFLVPVGYMSLKT